MTTKCETNLNTKKAFNCNICSYTSLYPGHLKTHMKTHSEKKLFKCTYCNFSTTYQCAITIHTRMHTRPFKCSLCNYSAAENNSVKIHMMTHTRYKPYERNVCLKPLAAGKDNLKQHMMKHSEEGSSKSSSDYQNLRDNAEENHSDEEVFKSSDFKFSPNQNLHQLEEKKCFQCPHCPYSTNDSSTFNRHLLTHTDEKPFKCLMCTYSCLKKIQLAIHARTHLKEKSFKCNECSQTFTAKKRLNKHMKKHLEEGSSNSSKFKSSDNQNLQEHDEENHSDEEVSKSSESIFSPNQNLHQLEENKCFQCPHCPYSTNDSSTFNRHLLTHTDEKPFQCPMCTYSCLRKIQLAIHTRTHLKDKSFKCNVCFQAFTTKKRLNKHMKKHSSEETPKFSDDSGLQEHLMDYSRENSYTCSRSEYECNDHQSLQHHELGHKEEKTLQRDFWNCKIRELDVHLKKHVNDESCEFSEDQSLQEGLIDSSGDVAAKQSHCEFNCNDQQSLQEHELGPKKEKSFNCNLCGFKAYDERELEIHLSNDLPYECCFCSYTCVGYYNLKTHMNIHYQPRCNVGKQ